MPDDELTEDAPAPLALVSGKRIFTIGLGVLVLGLMMQLVLSQMTLGGPILVLGVSIVIPLVAAVWAGRGRAASVWSPVLYGMLGGLAQVLMILIPLIITSILYPNRPGPSLWNTIVFGLVAMSLSAAIGAVVGGVVCVLLLLIQPRKVDPAQASE